MKAQYNILLLFIALIAGCHSNSTNNQKLVIASAANTQFLMEELIHYFSDSSGIECDLVVSSSGKLTAQILEGAPFDIFFSADMKYPEKIFNSGFSNSKPETYAYGKLVLWTMIEEVEPTIEVLTDDAVRHIALANPKTAPYGLAAKDVLDHYGIYENTEQKLVYGESIAQTNQFITTKAVDLGFTAKSVVLSKKMKGKGKWIEIDPDAYTPIAQGMVILKNANNQIKSAQMFHDFLKTEKGKEILNKFGYTFDN